MTGMDWKKLACGVLLSGGLAFTGCGDDGGGSSDAAADARSGPLPGACSDGECFFVADVLTVPGKGEGGVVPGFNIDGRVSDGSDEQSCGHPDFTSPDGTPGIDNQLAELKVTLNGFVQPMIGKPIDDAITDAIADGTALLLMELTGVDDSNDNDATFSIYLGDVPGGGSPALESGRLAPDQTFNLKAAAVDESGNPRVSVDARVENGRVVAGPLTLPIRFPVDGNQIELNIRNAELRADIEDGSLENGVIGGELLLSELLDTAEALGVPRDAVAAALSSSTDLNPDGNGDCLSLSVGVTFHAVDAVKGEVSPAE